MRTHRSGSGPGHVHGPVGGPGRRFFERGGIRFAILDMLKERPRHGYDIIRDMEVRSGGFYSPSPGAVYPTLQALEDQDLVSCTTEEGKKVYAITEAGVAYLEEHKDRATSHRERWESHWAPGERGESMEAMSGISETLREVKRTVRDNAADSAKMKEIGAALEEAAAKIREIVKK
jgi:DNA-binding PadR family transcriptional regulator